VDFEEDHGHGHYDEDEEEELGRETPSLTSSEEERLHLCQQRVRLEVDGDTMTMHTLCNWGSTVTLERRDAARGGASALPDPQADRQGNRREREHDQ
jgi:hypothetical protein